MVNGEIEKLEKYQQLCDKWSLLRWSTENLNENSDRWELERLEREKEIERELLEWEGWFLSLKMQLIHRLFMG